VQIDIAASIREVLDNMDAVSINAIGTLQLKHIPAYFSNKGTTLSPPSMALDIQDSITSNSPLIKTIAYNYGITKDAAKKLVGNFNKNILNNLVNYKKVSIEGVAVISRSEKGKLSIETTSGFVSSYYNELPEVKVMPNVKGNVQEDQLSTSTILPIPTKTEAIRPTPIEPSGTNNNGSNSINKKPKLTEPISTKKDSVDKKTEDLPDISSLKKAEPKTPAPKVERVVDSNVYKAAAPSEPIKPYVYEEKKPSLLLPLILLATLILLLLLGFKTCSKYAFTDDTNADNSKMTITDVDVIDGITATDSISTEALIELRKDKSIIPASGNCKIITGVFSRMINVIAMKEKLRDAGYNVYTEAFGEYTRVGLEFDCNEETDLEAYIQEVRRDIAARAWYLDPSLYVSY